MGKVVTSEAYRFMFDCFKAVGASPKAAKDQADMLLESEKIGRSSHGLNRLENYIKDVIAGNCMPNNEPKIVKEGPSTALVDANNTFGSTAAKFAMDIAIKKAKNTGAGWVTVKMANHFGMGGLWARLAANQGYIGMAFGNSSPVMAPTRSKKSVLGTNPLSVAAPGSCCEMFYLDIATTAVALGTIEMARRKGEKIPLGWAQGPDGKETTDADIALKTGCLMPLGGGEKNSGYKGYGLAAMVDLFCGISSGSNYGIQVIPWTKRTEGIAANLGQCFVALNPECFAPGFGDRLADAMQIWRNLEPTDPSRPVMSPGDIEKKLAAEIEERGYVMFVKEQLQSSAALAEKLKVKPMEVKNG